MRLTIQIGPDYKLTPDLVAKIASNPQVRIKLSSLAIKRIRLSRAVVERIVDKRKVVYGLTTGFGPFKDKFISKEQIEELQQNLIRSHSSGVGAPLSNEVVRAALVARLNSLAQGYSGVRLKLVEFLVELINKNVVPYVPSQGSVGASGDLAPLSHIGLIALGEGRAWYKGKLLSGSDALKRAKIIAPGFSAKEGLAWNNGTSVLTGTAALVVSRAKMFVDVADICCAMTLESVCGVDAAFTKKIHELRPHPGQIESASNIRSLIRGSGLVNSHPERVQDSYTLRCSPQVHGAIRDTLMHAEEVVTRELNSVNDNPIIFSNPDRAISGGNFHGEPIAIAIDALSIALSELGNISERRTAKLVDPATSQGLPAFLISEEKGGLHSGLMIPQYVAAALVSENKVLSHPASVDSIPTSANQEDHVSMGSIASNKALKISDNVRNILSIELLNSSQALEFRPKKKLAPKTKKIYQLIRRKVKPIKNDRVLSDDISKISAQLEDIRSLL